MHGDRTPNAANSGALRNGGDLGAGCLNLATLPRRDVKRPPPALPPRVDGQLGGTGEAPASTRVDRKISEACASPVTEVELDGDAEGTVAVPGRLRIGWRQGTGRLLNTAARRETTPPTLDVPAARSSRAPALQETRGDSHGGKERG